MSRVQRERCAEPGDEVCPNDEEGTETKDER
jgi:hypothetical protein